MNLTFYSTKILVKSYPISTRTNKIKKLNKQSLKLVEIHADQLSRL